MTIFTGTGWVQMILGIYPFSLRTAAYQELRRSARHRWVEQPRIGRAPALQYLGPGTQRITFNCRLHAVVNGGHRQPLLLRLLADRGQPLILVDGLGFSYGLWCMLDVEETGQFFTGDGAPRQQDLRLTIQAYGEDAA